MMKLLMQSKLLKGFQIFYSTCFPSFLQQMYPKFVDSVEDFIKRLKPLADGKTQVSLRKQMYAASMDVVSKVSIYSLSWCNHTHTRRGLINNLCKRIWECYLRHILNHVNIWILSERSFLICQNIEHYKISPKVVHYHPCLMCLVNNWLCCAPHANTCS